MPQRFSVYHSVVSRICELLQQRGVWFETFEHEAVRTGYTLHQGAKDVRFATEDEVRELTSDVQPGGVPPFGNLFGLEVVADPQLFDQEKIIFNAGDRRFSVGMRAADYREIVAPRVESIVG